MPSWKDPKNPTYGMCECEHISHSSEYDNDPRQMHKYEGAPATEEVMTPFGTFFVCKECSDRHLKDYKIE